MKQTGTKTAMNTSVVVISAEVMSCMASSVSESSLFTLHSSLSSLVCTASTTTMASSTTVPMTSTRAKSVSMFREKPMA